VLTGWGRTAPTEATTIAPADRDEAAAAVSRTERDGGLIGRGLGRSYGDAAQCAGGTVVDCTGVSRLRTLDLTTGVAVVDAGTSLDALMRWLVPLGWFVPVTPGTRYVTVGGAIASDIHGKNHHRSGTFTAHVDAMTLQPPGAEPRRLTPQDDPVPFWATAGGMGLTGMILDATVRLQPVDTSLLLVDTDRAADLDAVMALMDDGDDAYEYSVAWIDLMATGAAMGRSVLTRGRFATVDELPRRRRAAPLAFDPAVRLTAPRLVPSGLLNRLSVRAFNEAWFRKAPRRRRGELQTIATFFHPLDMIGEWNRLYGPKGFLQHQFVVPFGAEAALREAVERLSAAGCTSFLAVLKRFGAANPAPLSFPQPGWTLALDIPTGVRHLGPLLDELDRLVADAGGRVYLAKDSRLDPALVPVMYPRLDEWRAAAAELDPQGVMSSDLSRRLRLR
jgi:decaprenylphospho-beta-D-ribofuranose 2-oxidase